MFNIRASKRDVPVCPDTAPRSSVRFRCCRDPLCNSRRTFRLPVPHSGAAAVGAPAGCCSTGSHSIRTLSSKMQAVSFLTHSAQDRIASASQARGDNKNLFRHCNIAPQSKFFLKNASILSNGITARLSYRSVCTAPGIARNSLLAAYLLLRTISLKASFPK